MTTLRADSLSKRYGSRAVVSSVSFECAPGRVVAFLGPNGAGKTTTLRMLVGLSRPNEGVALIGGVPYRELLRPMATLGAVIDPIGFHPGRSGRGHLECLAVAGQLPRGRVSDVLGIVDLVSAADRPVRQYSLGMRQRLAIAGALLGDPSVLVLDEPANGLDPDGILWLRALLRRSAEEGRTALVSTHVLPEVEKVADDVVILRHGRIVAHQSLEKIGPTLESLYFSGTTSNGGAGT